MSTYVQTFVLHTDRDRVFALKAVGRAPFGRQVRISRPTRTPKQNQLLHAVLTDVADQLAWPPPPRNDGEFHDIEWWKRRCTLGWLRENKHNAELVIDLEEDDQFGILLPHTSDLNTEQCASLAEWVYRLGAENGVVFKEPKKEEEPPPREDDR